MKSQREITNEADVPKDYPLAGPIATIADLKAAVTQWPEATRLDFGVAVDRGFDSMMAPTGVMFYHDGRLYLGADSNLPMQWAHAVEFRDVSVDHQYWLRTPADIVALALPADTQVYIAARPLDIKSRRGRHFAAPVTSIGLLILTNWTDDPAAACWYVYDDTLSLWGDVP